MAQVADISQVLGDFMLKGYVLTDQSCPTRGCAIPMLRTPKGKAVTATFCVKCSDEGTPTSTAQTSPASPPSRSSTPPTEFSDASGLTRSEFELPPETDDMRRRREQSDQASSEIGKRLLQGWTMLGDECPNDSCYGVPLVSPRGSAAAVDLRKECVICGTLYKAEIDWAGRETLVPCKGDTAPASNDLSLPPLKRQRTSSPLRTSSPKLDIPTKNKNRSTESKPNLTVTGDALDDTSEALQISLQVLSSQLRKLSSCSSLDSNSIGMTADAIGKVMQALGHLRQLQLNLATNV